MKKVLNFVKGKKDEKSSTRINPQISVEITNPSGQKIPSDDEHIVGLQQGFGYSIDPNGKDKSMLKIHKASWFGQLEKVKLHAKKTDINSTDSQNRTCLHLAVAQGHTEVAWFLLNNNASITACDNDGMTPFLKGIECGQKDCTNLLIECGVDVNTTDGDGNSGLHIASRSGFYNIASLLLKEGANVNVPNNSGNYPLHAATSCDHRDIVELLIKYGANVQVLDRERRTALMLAARNGLCSIIKVLLENGALLETADSNGWTAEDYAQFGGHHDLIELLQTKKKEVSLDQSDKLSVHSSDQSEHVSFEAIKTTTFVNEDPMDSPRSCVIPPPLEPPRSWDLLQSGVIDQEGSLENRKSLLTLGNLKRGNNDIGSCELIVSPADVTQSTLSPSGDIPAEMRLSPEPLSLAPTPERRTRSPLERAPSVDLPSDSDSPLQGFSTQDSNSAVKHVNNNQACDNNDQILIENGATINDHVVPNLCEIDESLPSDGSNQLKENAATCIDHRVKRNTDRLTKSKCQGSDDAPINRSNGEEMDCSVLLDDLDDKIDNQLTGVSSSLDNIDCADGKSLSIEIVQSTGNLDDTLSITTTKNVFRESHSLELLGSAVGDTRSYKNNKRHHRNKSITLSGQPQIWNSVSTLPKTCTFDRGSIDAQLMCYDEALRQLANVKKIEAKDAQINTSPVRSDAKVTDEQRSDDTFEQLEVKMLSLSPASELVPITDSHSPTDELDFLDRESFPPPPIHFLQNDLCQMECDDKSIQIDVLPMPISMLTPIKETQVECDSLSVAETLENELTLSERSNIKSESTPNHFNVEVIVNNKTPSVSHSFDEAVVPGALETTEATLQLIDDVFIEDPTLAEPYDRYFVDLKTLEMVPSAVDFNKIVFPADSPSPKKSSRNGGTDKPANKSDSESECFGKPLRKKRKLLLAMRAPGVGGSKDTDNDMDENDIDEEDIDSDEEDPPFWQNTDKGGYFVRQDTIVAREPELEHLPRFSAVADPMMLSAKNIGKKPLGSPAQISEAETASASDTPRLSPMGIPEASQSHLGEPTLANSIWEEQAAVLMDNTARLKYELEDARLAEAERSDTISILQCQLSRLESQYAQAQEEVCMLKQKADSAELELKHLRELCACLSREKSEPVFAASKQLVDQATASTPTEDDYRQIHMQIMIKHLEDSKKLEEDKNHQLVRHLEEVLKTNQVMINEKEALIAQNIADVRKLQEDTLCWKERYEELAAKLELLDKRLDPRLIEAQDTIATLKRTIAILQQEKSHSKRTARVVGSDDRAQRARKTPCPPTNSESIATPSLAHDGTLQTPEVGNCESSAVQELLQKVVTLIISILDRGRRCIHWLSSAARLLLRSNLIFNNQTSRSIVALPTRRNRYVHRRKKRPKPILAAACQVASSSSILQTEVNTLAFKESLKGKSKHPIIGRKNEEQCFRELLRILESIFGVSRNFKIYKVVAKTFCPDAGVDEPEKVVSCEADDSDSDSELSSNSEPELLSEREISREEPFLKVYASVPYDETLSPKQSEFSDDDDLLVFSDDEEEYPLETPSTQQASSLQDDWLDEGPCTFGAMLSEERVEHLAVCKDDNVGECAESECSLQNLDGGPAQSERPCDEGEDDENGSYDLKQYSALDEEDSTARILSEIAELEDEDPKIDYSSSSAGSRTTPEPSNTDPTVQNPAKQALSKESNFVFLEMPGNSIETEPVIGAINDEGVQSIKNDDSKLSVQHSSKTNIKDRSVSSNVTTRRLHRNAVKVLGGSSISMLEGEGVQIVAIASDIKLDKDQLDEPSSTTPNETITPLNVPVGPAVNPVDSEENEVELPTTGNESGKSNEGSGASERKISNSVKFDSKNRINAPDSLDEIPRSLNELSIKHTQPFSKSNCKCCKCKRPVSSACRMSGQKPPAAAKKVPTTYFDRSSPQFPKNSLEVLNSPFYAHWSYFNVDRDHPISAFMKRTEFSLYDPTDHVIVKNVRIEGYNYPFATIGTRKKISAKLVCNYFKNQMARGTKGDRPPVASEARQPLSLPTKEPVLKPCGVKKPCCVKGEKPVSYLQTPVLDSRGNDAGDCLGTSFRGNRDAVNPYENRDNYEVEACCGRDNCSCFGNLSFHLNHKVKVKSKIELPSPCDSCKCFISDVGSADSSNLLQKQASPSPSSAAPQDQTSKKREVNDYILNLQEQCSQLCSMLGQVWNILQNDGSLSPVPTQTPGGGKRPTANARGGHKGCKCNKSTR